MFSSTWCVNGEITDDDEDCLGMKKCPCPCSSEAAPHLPQRSDGAVQHLRLSAVPRALLPRNVPLGEGQLRQELSLPLLRRLLRPGAGRGHAPEERRLPLHGHRGRLQGGGHLLQAGERREAPGRLPGLHPGAVAPARHGHPVAPLTAAIANANPPILTGPQEDEFAEYPSTRLG